MVFYSEGLEFMVKLVGVQEEATEFLLTDLKMPDICGLSTAGESSLLVEGMSVSELLREMNQLSGNNEKAANKIVTFRRGKFMEALKRTPGALKPSQA